MGRNRYHFDAIGFHPSIYLWCQGSLGMYIHWKLSKQIFVVPTLNPSSVVCVVLLLFLFLLLLLLLLLLFLRLCSRQMRQVHAWRNQTNQTDELKLLSWEIILQDLKFKYRVVTKIRNKNENNLLCSVSSVTVSDVIGSGCYFRVLFWKFRFQIIATIRSSLFHSTLFL